MSEEKHRKHKPEPEAEQLEQIPAEPEGARDTESQEEEDLQTRYLRLAADFQNFRRRSEKERSDVYAYANEKIVLELLDVISGFERAMDHTWEAGEAALWKDVHDPEAAPGCFGEEESCGGHRSAGTAFRSHEARRCDDRTSQTYESGKVARVMQKGYMLNKK